MCGVGAGQFLVFGAGAGQLSSFGAGALASAMFLVPSPVPVQVNIGKMVLVLVPVD